MMSIKSPYFEHPESKNKLSNAVPMASLQLSKVQSVNVSANKTIGMEDLQMAASNISFADDTTSTAKKVQKENFAKKHRFQCTFCLGKACSKEKWQKCANPIIHGLHSNMIEDKIIGSQRPSTRKIEKYNVIE